MARAGAMPGFRLVELEIDVDHFVIHADFQAGVEHALGLQGRVIARVGAPPPAAKAAANILG